MLLAFPKIFSLRIFQVLSGNVPFCQYRAEKVALAMIKGKRPTRPSQEGLGGEEIDDVAWRPTSACWEFEPEDRPSSLNLHEAFSNMDISDDRPVLQPMIQPAALRAIEDPAIDLENMRSLLNRVVGSNQLLPPPSRIPEQLREPLSGLADNPAKAETVAIAAKRLKPDDTQTLVDALDLVSLC
jgi:hypothetical protein